jgi:preprotein translocase subunit SecY
VAKNKQSEQMATGKYSELKSRLLFVLGALLVFRLGTFIPVPGIDPGALAIMFEQQKGTILDMFNMFSGGALERLSVFALGIMPYISASIIMQLLTVVHPKLAQMKKEGAAGKRKITQYTRYGTLVLATFQALGIAIALESQSAAGVGVVIDPGMIFRVSAVITLVTGTMFLMWLGEQITERGIGNGISLIIFAGIVAGLPSAVGGTLELARTGQLHTFLVITIAFLALAVTAFVVFVERAQRRIPVHYAKRQQGRSRSSHPSTTKIKHGRCDSPDIRLKYYPVSSNYCRMVWQCTRDGLAERYIDPDVTRATNVCVVICYCDYIFLLLLHGASIQS